MLVFSLFTILFVGFTSVTVPDSVPGSVAGPIEEAANGSSDFASNPGDVLNQSGEVLAPPEVDQSKLEKEIHEEVNNVRAEHSKSALSLDPELSEIADYHSEDMANNDYYAHDSPTGETMEDRYEKFGYECRVPVSGNQYMTGAENINKVYWNTETTTYERTTNETKLAKITVSQWMDSPPHRENILRSEWENEGIGIAVSENSDGDTVVYVTQNFC